MAVPCGRAGTETRLVGNVPSMDERHGTAMNEYTASNGATVEKVFVTPSWYSAKVCTVDNSIHLPGVHVDALREFFRAERDAELGRWRSAKYPDFYARRVSVDEVGVTNERNNQYCIVHLAQSLAISTFRIVAMEFVEAHPEPKPWQKAQVGEVWVLSTADGETDAYTAMPERGLGISFEAPEGRYALNDADIETARRIWPEDAS